MPGSAVDQLEELQGLRERLAAAEETLRAIREGDIDAVIVNAVGVPAVYTIKNADTPYRLLVEQMEEGALTVSGAGVILYCNAAFANMVGVSSERLRGALLNNYIAEPTNWHSANIFQSARTTGQDIRLRTSSGGVRNAFVSWSPITVEGDSVHCVVVTDLTRQELRRRHEAIVGSSPDAIYSLTPEGTITTWNRAAEELYGYPAQEAIGRNVDMLFPPEQRGSWKMTPARFVQENLVHHETERISKSGKRLDVALSFAPIRAASGEVEGISVIARDISVRKRAQNHLQFVLRESSHRSKNLLAIIQAIASQTARSAGTIEEFAERFRQRLHAIALSNDLLVNENWRRASIGELVRQQLGPFVEPGLRLELDGPDVFLTPDAAQHIGLALHELATNAMKYGALSVPTGTVRVAWKLEDNDQRLQLSWRERNGPRVSLPSRLGFGSTVIDSLTAQSLNGSVATDFAPEGFSWELCVPDGQAIAVDGANDESPPANSPAFGV